MGLPDITKYLLASRASLINNGGALSIVMTPDDTKFVSAAVNTASYTVVTSGANAIVQVTGVPTFTINWRGVINITTAP